MSEVVGNVSLELSIDRDQFDRQLEQLKKTKLESLKIQAQLDTTTLNKQLAAYRAVSNIRLGVTLDGRAAATELNDLTKARSIAVTAVADTRAAAAAIDTLTQNRSVKISAILDSSELSKSIQSLAVNQTIKISTSVDVSAAANQINQLLRPRTIAVRFDVNDSGLNKPIRKPETKLKAIVDDSALTKLNEHLSLKERHFKQVQALFSGSPLTPKVDDRSLKDLNSSIDRSRGKYDRFKTDLGKGVSLQINTDSVDGAIDKLANFKTKLNNISASINVSSAVKVDTDGVKDAFRYGSSQIERSTSNLFKDLASAIGRAGTSSGSRGGLVGSAVSFTMSPLKLAAGTFSTIISGGLAQIGMDFSKKLSSGFLEGLSAGIAPIFGSSGLVGQKLGEVSAKLFSKPLQVLKPFVREHISEEEAATEYAANRGTARKKQQTKIKLAENQVQTEQQFFQENLPQIQQFATRLKGKQGIYDSGRSELDKEVQAAIDEKTAADRAEIARLSKMRGQIIEAPAKAVSREALPRLNERQSEIKREMKKTANLQQRAALTSEFAANEQAILEINSPEKAKQLKVEQLTRKISQTSERVSNTSQDVKDRYAPDYKQFDVMAKKIEADRAALTKMSIGMNATPIQTEVFGERAESRKQVEAKKLEIAQMKQEYSKLSKTLEKYIAVNTTQIQEKYTKAIAGIDSEIAELEAQSLGSLSDGKATSETISIQESLKKKKAERQIAQRGYSVAPTSARSAVSTQSKELSQMAKSIKDEEAALSRMKSSASRPSIENIGVESIASKEKKAKKEMAEFVANNPKEYVELAKIVMGEKFSTKQLPKIKTMSEEEYAKSTSEASYSPSQNRITVSPSIGRDVKSGSVLSPSTSRTLGEELGHAVDTDFGSADGLKAFKSGRVYGKKTTPTKAEFAEIAPDLGRYGADVREIELSGKTRALRASKEYQESRMTASRQSSASNEIAYLSNTEKSSSVASNKLKELSAISEELGIDISETIGLLARKIAEADTKITALKRQSLESAVNLDAPRADISQIPTIEKNVGLIDELTSRKLEPLQALKDARSIAIPDTQEAKYQNSILGGSNKALKTAGLSNNLDAVKEVSAEIKAIEAESKALQKKIKSLTPETAKAQSPEIKSKSAELQSRMTDVNQAIGIVRSDTEATAPGSYDRSKSRIDKQIAIKEKAVQAAELAKKGAGKVKDAVFNPDREISIDMDKVKAGVQVTGRALYGSGLAIAKTMDAINVGFNALAQSNPGQRVLGATREASTALLHVAKTGYGLAKGVEDATLSIVPFGKTAKAGIQNIGLPMLAANVAASHIPGGQMLLEGAGNVANMALGPLAHGGVSAMAQGAGSAIGGIFPQFGGLGAHVAGGVSGLIEGGLGSAITPAIEAAVALVTGKLMMNTAGSAVAQLPGVAEITGAKAIMPSSPRALPQAKTLALPGSEPQLQDLTDKQLRAYAKTQGLSFGKKAKKDDVIARIEQTTPRDLGDLASAIGSQFNRKGQAIGVDVKSESAMIAQLKQQEKKIHALHAQAKASMGRDRAMMVEQLLHESIAFSGELEKVNRTPMSGANSKAVGQMLGRVESFTRHSEGNSEARDNRSATIKASLQGPVYGQTIEAQAQRLYRVADEKQLNIFQKLRNLLSKRSNAVAELNFKSLYAEIAMSNKLTDIDSNIPTLAIGKENSYDPNSNTVSVTKRAYRELSKPIGKLRPDQIKPVTHEIQHSQQLDGGNRSIAEAAYGSSDYSFGLSNKPLPKRVQRQVNASVTKGSNPQTADAVRRLEVDAYNKESQTKEFLDNLKASSVQKMPVSTISERITSAYTALSDGFLGAIDSIKSVIPKRSAKTLPKSLEKLEAELNSPSINEGVARLEKTIGVNERPKKPILRQKSTVKDIEPPKNPGKFEDDFNRSSSRFDEAERRILEEPETLKYNWLEKLLGTSSSTRTQRRKSALPKGFKANTSEKAGILGSDASAGFDNASQRFDETADSINLKYNAILNGEQPKSEFAALSKLLGRPINNPFEGIKNGAKQLAPLLAPLRNNMMLLAAPIALGALTTALPMLKQFAAQAVQASIAADRMKTSLEFSTGSKGGADRAYQFADNTANKFGVDRKSSIEGYAKIRASSKGKISEGQVNELYTGISAASTTLGLSGEDQNGVMLALGQMMSKGTVQAEELRGQIGERLPGAFATAARSMGVTEQQLGKMMETGSIMSDQFIPKFAQQLIREFGGGAEKASQNLQSSLFRMQGAMDRISESAGSAAAPAMQGFVNIAVGGLDLIAKYGQQVSSIFSIMMAGAIVKVGGAAIVFITPMITSFLAYNGIAATIPGVLGAIGGSLSGLIPIVGVFMAKFLLINAGIEIAKTLFSAFTPSDMATRFTSQADKINKSLKEMEENGNKAKGAMPSEAPSKGLDINAATLGLSGAIGVNKGDDLVKGLNSNPMIRDALAFALAPIGLAKQANERNGGTGLATMQEVQFNNEKIALNEGQGDQVNALTGKAYSDRGKFSKSLETAQAEQKIIDEKQAEKNRLLSGGGNNKEAVANIDKQINESAARRDNAGKEFSTYRDTVQSSIAELKNQKESIAKSADYSSDQKKNLDASVSAQLSNLESVKKQMDDLDRKFNGSGDIISKFNVSMSEMAAKIEEVSAAAENSFNKSEVSRLQDKRKGRQTDEFASTNSAERQAGNEYNMASQKLSGTQKAIAEVDKIMQDPTVQRDLAKITVNGKSIDGETSASQLEQAKAGKTDGEKQRIEKLISRRKAIDSVPTLQKNQLEADEKKKEARSSNEIAKMDRRFENREVQFKEFEGKANIGLINAQKGNRIDKSDVDIRSAEIQGISAKEQQSVVKDKMASIKKLYDTGVISKEEYIKRSIGLRGQLTEANTKAAQAELAIEQAKNAKILRDYEITVKKRELADKRIRSEALISLAKAQKGNRMSEDDVNVKKAEIDSASADRGAANIGQQIQELESLKDRGVITHEDYVKRKLDLDSSYLDAKVRQADAELALEKAKNQKIVNEFDKLQQQKAFKLEQAQGNKLNDIKEQALAGKVVGFGGEKEAREERIKTSEKKLADLAEKSRGIDKLRNVGMSSDKDFQALREQAKYGYSGSGGGDSSAMDALNQKRGSGVISQKEYETRKMEVQNAYRLEKENLLNLQIAKRLALYQAEADVFKRANTDIIRGLEKQRSAFEISKTTMSSKQGVIEAELGFSRATQENKEARLGQGEGSDIAIARSRVQSLAQVQIIEMRILDIKEKQQRTTLRQAEIESTIAVAKQKIAVNEAKKKLKDTKLTGDVDAIANAQDDLIGQNQILGLENDKKNALKEQNALAEQRLGIERKTAELGMDTERIKARSAVKNLQASKASAAGGASGSGAGGSVDDGVNRNIDSLTGNMIIGGGNFLAGEGIKPNLLGGVNPANLGAAAAAVDIGSRVQPKNSTVNSFEVATDKGSNKIVGAIEKLGSDIKSAPNKSESKPISGDYSGLINGLVDSSNARN